MARLATISAATGAIDLVPVTFVLMGECLFTAVDHKPKATRDLARLANVRSSGTATALVDHWTEDWTQLWWLRLRGPAEVVDDVSRPDALDAIDALVAKYAPYRAQRPAGPLIVLTFTDVRTWSAL